MSVKVINSSNTEDFNEVANMFYNHFCPDDWDYLIIGDDKAEVEDMAYKLHIFDYEVKSVATSGQAMWVAVTYHS